MFLRASTTLATVCVVCFFRQVVADDKQTSAVRLSNDSLAIPESVAVSPSKLDTLQKSVLPEPDKAVEYPDDEADEDESAGVSNETEVRLVRFLCCTTVEKMT